jgi:hypothetical protein
VLRSYPRQRQAAGISILQPKLLGKWLLVFGILTTAACSAAPQSDFNPSAGAVHLKEEYGFDPAMAAATNDCPCRCPGRCAPTSMSSAGRFRPVCRGCNCVTTLRRNSVGAGASTSTSPSRGPALSVPCGVTTAKCGGGSNRPSCLHGRSRRLRLRRADYVPARPLIRGRLGSWAPRLSSLQIATISLVGCPQNFSWLHAPILSRGLVQR